MKTIKESAAPANGRWVRCRKCKAETPNDETADLFSISRTTTGDVQVWCVRHDEKIVVINADKPKAT